MFACLHIQSYGKLPSTSWQDPTLVLFFFHSDLHWRFVYCCKAYIQACDGLQNLTKSFCRVGSLLQCSAISVLEASGVCGGLLLQSWMTAGVTMLCRMRLAEKTHCWEQCQLIKRWPLLGRQWGCGYVHKIATWNFGCTGSVEGMQHCINIRSINITVSQACRSCHHDQHCNDPCKPDCCHVKHWCIYGSVSLRLVLVVLVSGPDSRWNICSARSELTDQPKLQGLAVPCSKKWLSLLCSIELQPKAQCKAQMNYSKTQHHWSSTLCWDMVLTSV